MKTTFDIPEPLLRDVQALARERRETTKSLVEQALRRLLDEAGRGAQFELQDATFHGGTGFTPEFAEGTAAQLRDAAYGVYP